MKQYIITTLTMLLSVVMVQAQLTVTSPSGNNRIEICQGADGLTYTVSHNGSTVVPYCALHLYNKTEQYVALPLRYLI